MASPEVAAIALASRFVSGRTVAACSFVRGDTWQKAFHCETDQRWASKASLTGHCPTGATERPTGNYYFDVSPAIEGHDALTAVVTKDPDGWFVHDFAWREAPAPSCP